jgi:HD-GYP domain-containing protein (c-di-GMP phosphodiesterase class II)
MALRLARLAGLEADQLTQFWRGAMLHDIGNMTLPESILLKPGKLTDQEWKAVRAHPLQAHELLTAIPDLGGAVDIPFCHHERWDGCGYPRGLKGSDIPVPALIFSVVDVYDALTSDRPFRKACLPEQAVEHIRAESGKSFSPAIVETFLKNLPVIVDAGY